MLFFCVAAPGRAAGEYQTVNIEGLQIEIDSDWAVRSAPGYLPVRFAITNTGEARVIEIVGTGSRYFRGTRGMQVGGIDVVQAVRLARGDRVRLTIPVPISADNESLRFEIREDGRTLEHFSYQGFQGRSPPAHTSALLVTDPASVFGAVAPTLLRSMAVAAGSSFTTYIPSAPVTGAGAPPLDFVLAPGRLPANWLGYTSLRAVLIGPREWEQLNAAQKNALLTWTACGGDLFFVDGDWRTLFPAAQPAAGADDRAPRAYFFGRIHRPTAASVAGDGLQQVLTAAQKLQDGNWSLPANGASDWGAVGARGFRLPIPGIEGVPVRVYLVILGLFSLVIGPANFWFLRRVRQPVLLVLTAPLISAIFVVLLAGYVVMGEGFAVRGRAVTVTMLDQVRNQASTRGSASLYAAGMAPSGGLRFPRHAAVFPLGPEGTGSRERHFLDLTDAQHFSSGVIAARSPTNIEQITFRTARERLSFTREAGGGMTVVNGLGATVTALFYREGDTVYGLGGPLSAGGKATLKTAAPRTVVPGVPNAGPLKARIERLFEQQPAGSYLAVLERSPFWEPGVADVVEQDSFHLVIGWPEGQP
jgi:hypothetical protein